MSGFSDLGLSSNALVAVGKLGFEQPTPIQQQAIPHILDGEDVIAAASTGTGKTAAFLLPALSHLPSSREHGRRPRMLVITPTRELAQQIARTCIAIGKCTGHYVSAVYGGMKYSKQKSDLAGGTDVLVATPGRLGDLMDRQAVDLSQVEVLVLDEADRMLDMGFLPDVTRIVEATPDARQTLLFSATIDKRIRTKLGGMLRDARLIQIAKRGETAANVKHYLMPIKQKDKPALLLAVLGEIPFQRVIVFARTKARAEDVTEALAKADVDAVSLHSDRTQAERRAALRSFGRGEVKVIVATDVLARGIDVPAVDYVVNYDLPDMAEDYIHRIGRTGRAGAQGLAISFVSQNSLKALASIERLIGQQIPLRRLSSYEVDVQLLQSRREKRAQLSHSDKRAANFASVRAARRARHSAERSDYNYEGWGDKRRGSKGTSDTDRGAPKKAGRRGAARHAPSRTKASARPASSKTPRSKRSGERKHR